MNKKSLYSLIAVVAVFVVGAVFWTGHSQKNQYDGPLEQVVFAPKWVHQAQFAGMYIAQKKGLYLDQGIDLKFNNFQAGENAGKKVLAGEADFGLMNGTGFLREIEQGSELVALGVIYQYSPYALISLEGRGIHNPFQLKDKRIGIKGGIGSENELIAELLLESAGLNRNDAQIIPLGFDTSERDDLVEERADVVGFYRTRLYQFEKEGLAYDLVSPEKYEVSSYNDVIVAKKSFVEQNPELTRRFLSATIRGWNYALDNPEEAVDVTMQYVSLPEYNIREYQKSILSASTPLIRPEENFSIGAMNLEKWKDLQQTLIKNDFLSSDFDLEPYIDTQYLP